MSTGTDVIMLLSSPFLIRWGFALPDATPMGICVGYIFGLNSPVTRFVNVIKVALSSGQEMGQSNKPLSLNLTSDIKRSDNFSTVRLLHEAQKIKRCFLALIWTLFRLPLLLKLSQGKISRPYIGEVLVLQNCDNMTHNITQLGRQAHPGMSVTYFH